MGINSIYYYFSDYSNVVGLPLPLFDQLMNEVIEWI